MKYKEFLLQEKFKTATTIDGDYFEFFEDPTKREQGEILKSMSNVRASSLSFGAIRFSVSNSKNPRLFAWRGDLLHYDAKRVPGLDFDVGLTYIQPTKMIEIDQMVTGLQKGWNDYKHKEAAMKKAIKIFDVKYIKTFDMDKKMLIKDYISTL